MVIIDRTSESVSKSAQLNVFFIRVVVMVSLHATETLRQEEKQTKENRKKKIGRRKTRQSKRKSHTVIKEQVESDK